MIHKTLVSETGWNFNCTLCMFYVVKVIYIYMYVTSLISVPVSLWCEILVVNHLQVHMNMQTICKRDPVLKRVYACSNTVL